MVRGPLCRDREPFVMAPPLVACSFVETRKYVTAGASTLSATGLDTAVNVSITEVMAGIPVSFLPAGRLSGRVAMLPSFASAFPVSILLQHLRTHPIGIRLRIPAGVCFCQGEPHEWVRQCGQVRAVPMYDPDLEGTLRCWRLQICALLTHHGHAARQRSPDGSPRPVPQSGQRPVHQRTPENPQSAPSPCARSCQVRSSLLLRLPARR